MKRQVSPPKLSMKDEVLSPPVWLSFLQSFSKRRLPPANRNATEFPKPYVGVRTTLLNSAQLALSYL